MPGLCKLCLKNKDLQSSHLLGACFYRIIRKSQGSDPVVITAKAARVSSRQVIAHELCWDCEQLFRHNGEDWMARQVFQGKEFPLLSRLQLAIPEWEKHNHTAYSGSACGIDTEKLVYFGASALWRSSLRRWTVGAGETTTVDLGSNQELLRRFLLGETSFPDAVVIATVCTDYESQACFFPPCAIREGIAPGYSLLVLGVSLRFFFGPVPADFQKFCCVQHKRIIVANHREQSLHSYGHLSRTAKESPGLVRSLADFGMKSV